VPSLQLVTGVVKQRKAQGRRREGKGVACKKARMRMHESVGQIPSPFIHSHDIWKKHHARCLVFAPSQSTPTLTRGPGAHQSISMGQPIGNSRRQGTPQMLHAVHDSRVYLGTMAVIASTPTTLVAP
jgi:hypothetical protein